MEFKIVHGDEARYFSDDRARYWFSPHGLLVVADGEGKQFTYSPGAWSYIEEPEREVGLPGTAM